MDAVLLSFDNLGEASELERGTWPAAQELGRHPSVMQALPRLLDELERQRLTGTFFLEAINCELYPDALANMLIRVVISCTPSAQICRATSAAARSPERTAPSM